MENTLYLLTGAAGLLGSNISRALIAQGKQVRALVLKGDPAAKYIPAEVEVITGDLLDMDSLETFFAVPAGTASIVIHCASFVTVSPDHNPKVYAVNVTGTENILTKCLEHKVKKLVYISSTGAIMELPNGQVISEPVSFDPKSIIGYYGKTKAEATQLVLDTVREKDLDASIVYPSGICGPNDFAYGPVARFIIDYVQGDMPAGVDGNFNSVDVRDLADGVIACAEKGRKGEGYIMSNSIVSMKDMFDLIRRFTGAPKVKFILPIPLARVVALFASLGSKITAKPAMLTSFAIYNLARNNNFSSKKAERELGYHTRPFEETIADTVTWLKNEKKITITGSILKHSAVSPAQNNVR